MLRIIQITSTLALLCISQPSFAVEAPDLSVSTSGVDVSLSWTSASGATGYTLYYAPYPYEGEHSIGSIGMGVATNFSATLWDGASYYVAITASGDSEESGYSNIEIFTLIEDLIVCTAEYNPVCGVNGNTYSNSCYADIAGVEIQYQGECIHCDSNNLDLCTTSSTCEEAGGCWWSDDTCNSTQEPIGTVTSAGQVWLDRNLGASQVASSYDDEDAYGDLYQWGRGTEGHEKRDSSTTSTVSSSDDPGHGSFITGSSDWRSPQNDNLWQGESGINNPCPAGFRLPTETELETEMYSWSSDDYYGAYDSSLKLVAAGYRYRVDGSVYHAGSDGLGLYWSSTVSDGYARYLGFFSDSARMGNNYRANGFSARCIED